MSGFVKFAQYLCVAIALISVNTAHGQYQHYLDSSNFNELYRHTDEPLIKVLAPGDSESEFLELNPPVYFYSSKYDGVYINTNGILTFVIEFPEYLNHPFPLEYPSIAAFYSNVDTSNGNDSTSISIFQTQNADKLEKASGLIRYSFPEMYDFEATTLYVATWENVGYFSGKSDKLNTFQAIIICNEEETYVQFIYPKGGLNWLQADTGELGLPDIRAQAGFISEDERFYTVDGSGTDNARFLSRMSNVGVEGVYLYRVGPLDEAGNVHEPLNEDTVTETAEPTTCAEGKRKCHITAACVDKRDGFCCRCAAGFYGNGESCIKENVPIRVTGSVSGKINDIEIESSAKLQSYIVMQDGRSYTVINPISTNLGAQLKLALPIAGSLGWLFAKPVSADKLNGYQLTGGHLLHTSRMTFHSGEVLLINQTFEGLNYWDQLSVKIQISGEVPTISPEVKLQMAEFVEEYTFTSPNSLVSDANRQIDIPSQNSAIVFDLHQEISFNRCSLDDDPALTGTTVLQKISKISLEFSANDLALRSGLQAKVGVSSARDSCADDGDCGCRDGYERQNIDDETEGCVDIDECAIGIHICDENAFCSNLPGGYTCVCEDGYFGNGKECDPIESNHLAEVENDVILGKEAEKEEEEKRRMQEEERMRQEEERLRQMEERRRVDEKRRRLEEETSREDEKRRRDESNRMAEEERIKATEERRRLDEERWRGREESLQEEYDTKVEDEEEQRREEDRRDHVKWDNTRSEEEEQISEQDLEKQAEPSSDCYRCSKDANCVEGRCECREGYNGNGFICQYNCFHETELWEDGKCVRYTPDESEVAPTCTGFGDCSCPDGYDLSDEENICRSASSSSQQAGKGGSDSVPCDVDNACHHNATCEWSEEDMRHVCICNHGYLGDGFTCSKTNESCTMNPDLCGTHATCEYNESIGKSECQCEPHYEGDGFLCQRSAECRSDTDCGQSAFCDKGVCQCIEGYERDLSDFCVPAGMCGGTFCAGNAACKWDSKQSVQYCECMEGYTGDGVTACKSVPISCRVRNTCGVHASCIPSRTDPAQYECVCDGGFYGDGYLCMEEQNCQNTPTLCDPNAKCQSVTNGIACVCNPGYLGNGTVCRVRPTHDSGFLLISQGVVIVRVPFNGKQGRPISVASMTVGLDKDCIEGRVYWGDISTKKIVSAKYDGTDNRPLITEDIMSPEGIAIDAVSRRIYWTDSEKDTVEVASLDNPNMRAVLVNKYLVNPRGIAVDPYREKLYWSDWNRESPKIEMSNLDGTGREILLSKPSVSLPNSLVVIRDSGALCFADAGSHKIECIDFYTKQVRTVASDLNYPFGLASTDSNFYWTDWMSKKLESVDTFGKRQPGMQTTFYGSHKMYGMVAVEEYCPQHSNPCQMNNGGCGEDRICLANSRAPSGKSCKCTMKSKCIMSYDENIYQSP